MATPNRESDEDKQKVLKSGPIIDPDRLFNDIATVIYDKYMEIGIELGLQQKVLKNELETRELKMKQGNKKALQMLVLWKQSVDEDRCTYSALAAALEKHGFLRYSHKYCYTSTGEKTLSTTPSPLPLCVTKYAKCLKDLYLQMPLFPQPEWPPSNATEATKLVIVSTTPSIDSNSESKKIASIKHDYFYKSDNIVGYKKEIEFSDILNPVPSTNSDDPPKVPKVLIDGAPGVGKTTLAIKACIDWAKHRLFKKYHLVILVSLRQAKYDSLKKLKHLFPCDCSKEVIEHCKSSSGENVLMIFDGYDELTFMQRECQSIFLDIIHGKILPKCSIIVTSRPYASTYLHSLKSINRHVEVLGFKKEQIYNCIQRNLSDRLNADALIQQLEEREDILSLCYIPLNCLIMIHVYGKRKMLPVTMTELFHQFLIDSVKRDITVIRKSLELSRVTIDDLHNLPNPIDKQLAALEKVAFECLREDQFLFSHKQLQSVFSELGCHVQGLDISSLCLGLITAVYINEQCYYQFLHLSIQEYLAAMYAVSCKTFEQVDILLNFLDDPRYRLFLLFFVGMQPLDQYTFETVFDAKRFRKGRHEKSYTDYFNTFKPDPLMSRFLYCAHMIYESQETKTFSYLLDLLNEVNNNVLSLKHYKLTQFDCTVLANFLCSTQHSWKELDLQDCSLTVSSLKVFDRVYQQHNRQLAATFQSINLSQNDANIANSLELFPWVSNVKNLTFESDVEAVSKPLELSSIAHISQLCIDVKFELPDHGFTSEEVRTYSKKCTCKTTARELTLCQASLGESFRKFLHGIEELNLLKVEDQCLTVVTSFIKTLKVLTISEIDDIDGWLHQSACGISCTKSLEKLTLLNIGITCDGAVILFQAIRANTSIMELNISVRSMIIHEFNQQQHLGQEIESLLSDNKTIKFLQLSNCIGNSSVCFFNAGLKQNVTLEKLDVCKNCLTISNIESIIMVAMNHDCLTELSIEDSKFQKSNEKWCLNESKQPTPHLLCALSNLEYINKNNFETFNVTGTDLDIFSIIRLFQTIQDNKHMKHLKINGSIQHVAKDKSVACSMERMLSGNNTLETLEYLTSNDKEPEFVYRCLATGLSQSSSLNKLVVDLPSSSSMACFVRYLTKSRLQEVTLNIKSSRHHGCSSSNNDCSKLLGLAFNDFLTNNNTVNKLKLGLFVDDEVLVGVANGLQTNKCLKKIELYFDSTVSISAESFFISVCKSSLTSVKVSGLCCLTRADFSLDWTVEIFESGLSKWFQLKHAFLSKDVCSFLHISVSGYLHSTSHEILYRLISFLNHRKNIKILNISQTSSIFYEKRCTSEGRRISKTIEALLKESNSLEELTLKGTWLPQRTWEYAADALKENKSLKALDLSDCRLLPREAAKLFSSLVSNCSLEVLNLSGNPDINDDTSVCTSIQKMFKSNCSLTEVNLSGSIDDEIAKHAFKGLYGNPTSKVMKLRLDGTSLSITTMQNFLSHIKEGCLVQVELGGFSFSRENYTDSDHMWSRFVNLTLTNIISEHQPLLRCSSCKIFFSLCNICSEMGVILNVTGLQLDNVADNDTVLAILSSLGQTSLSRLSTLSLQATYGYTLRGPQIGNALKEMLSSNQIIRQLTLPKIDAHVLIGLTSGLSNNNTVEKVKVRIDPMSINESNLVTLLRAITNPNAGLLELDISEGVPLISRPMRWSQWGIRQKTQEILKISSDTREQFVFSMSEICNDESSGVSAVAKHILSSWQNLYLIVGDPRQFSFIEYMLKFLMSSDIFKTLYLTVQSVSWMVRSRRDSVCKAIKEFLVKNVTLENLILSGDFDEAMSSQLVAGLQGNKGLKLIQVERDTFSIKMVAKILDTVLYSDRISVSCIVHLSNIVRLTKEDNSMWQIRILEKSAWLSFIEELTPHIEPSSPLNLLKSIHCVSPNFDATCKHLKFVEEEARLTEDGEVEVCGLGIRNFMTELKTLSILDLENCCISDDMCDAIASGLKSSASLQKLNLQYNDIHGKGIVKLFQVLQLNSTLQELDVSYNNLEHSENDEGIRASLELVLKKNCLKTLKLAHCYIGDKTCESIAMGLISNDSLMCLDLSYNYISCIGINLLMLCLESNSYLQKLNLSRNCDGDNRDRSSLGQALHKMLVCNKTLSIFHFNSEIGGEVLSEITNGLQKNSTLKMLTLNFDLKNCSKVWFESLMKSNITCFNFAEDFSLCSSSSGWTFEIKAATNSLAHNYIFCADYVHFNNLIISKFALSSLDFINAKLNFGGRILIRIFKSLEWNQTVSRLKLQLDSNFNQPECKEFGQVLKDVLTKNTVLESLLMYGDMDLEILNALEIGLKANTHLSEVLVQIEHQKLSAIVNFIQSTEDTRLLKVSIYPLIQIDRANEHCSWRLYSQYLSPNWLEFYCSIYKTTDVLINASIFSTLQVLDMSKFNITDAEFYSLFCALESNTSLNVIRFKTINEMASCSLESMLTKNKGLQELYIDADLNDSLALAIAKGLKQNNSLQTLCVSVDQLSEGCLTELLQSLCTNPLKLIDELDGCHVSFVRCTVPSLVEKASQEIVGPRKSPTLAKILKCFKPTCCLKDLTITHTMQKNSFSQVVYTNEDLTCALTELLQTCNTLQEFKLLCRVSAGVILGLSTGLKENHNLHLLQINAANLTVNDTLPIIRALPHSSVVKLELLDRYLFCKMQESSRWKITFFKYFDLTSYTQILNLGIETDSIMSKIGILDLDLSSENYKKMLTIFKSVEIGTLPVDVLKLVFVPAEFEESISNEIGTAIRKMIQSNKNKSLERLIVENLRDKVIVEHCVAGLIHSSTLKKVTIIDHAYECNILAQTLLKCNLNITSIYKMKINDICLYNKTAKRKLFQHSSEKLDKDPRAWQLKTSDKKCIARMFKFLSEIESSELHHCSDTALSISVAVLQNLKKLDFSFSNLNLAEVFNVLQHDTQVVELNLSYCEDQGSINLQQAFKEMLIGNTSLECLNLTGLMDNCFADSLIEVLKLPTCSLRSLSIDLNIKTYTFEVVEALIRSFVDSTLIELHFMDICTLQKEESSWYIGFDSHKSQSTDYLSHKLLRSWSTLFMLVTLSKLVSAFDLTLGAFNDKLFLQLLKMLFKSMERISHTDTDIDDSICPQSLIGFHLLLSDEQKELATDIVGFLQSCHSSNTKQLSITFDGGILSSECQTLATSYNQLLCMNKTLEVLNVGILNDTIACELASGLQHNNTLHTLNFSLGTLSIDSFSNLLEQFLESKLTTLNITDCCTIEKRNERFTVDFFGSETSLYTIFIALVQVSPSSCSKTLIASLLPGKKLDLSNHVVTNYKIANNVFECLADKGASFVSELVVSGRTGLMKSDQDEDTLVSALEGLLTSEDSTLETLRLNDCQLSDNVCKKLSEALKGSKMLKNLDLRSNKLTFHGVNVLFAALARNGVLQELDLSQNEFIVPQVVNQPTALDRIKRTLQTNKVLSVLNLSESRCEPLCREISIGLAMNKALHKLYLQINEESAVMKLFESVEQCRSLKELHIAESCVDHPPAGSALCQMLKNNCSLEVLSIQVSGVSDEICDLIADGIAQNNSLRKLDLRNNYIHGNGVVSLFKVLDTSNMCNLKELDLSRNNPPGVLPVTVSPECAIALADNSTLEVLSISDCEFFTRFFGIALFNGLKRNTKLRNLDVSTTYFDDEMLEVFADMLSDNEVLAELNISYCEFAILDRLHPWTKEILLSAKYRLKKIIVDVKTCSLLDFDDDTFTRVVDFGRS